MSAGRVRLTQSSIVAAVAAILLAAGWSLTAAPRPDVAPRAGELAMAGGIAHVDRVVSAARPQHAMPGMGTDNDPVAAGERRVSVDVTLFATDDEPLEYHVGDFEMAVPGGTPRRPRRAILPGRSLPSGTQLSGTLVFDVPDTTTRVRLSYDGSPGTDVVLPRESRAPPAGPTATATDHSPHPTSADHTR
jgi:hypothetical protein